ncbi:DUF6192 family protein [Streptomyces sp. NPDC057137]|uniref:DUF6192 family protein n=1 Tax=Streptomyces sp. NPDC057137 TaxID=3346030 RepID=UPI00362B3DD5
MEFLDLVTACHSFIAAGRAVPDPDPRDRTLDENWRTAINRTDPAAKGSLDSVRGRAGA